jgi:hypothetical protein
VTVRVPGPRWSDLIYGITAWFARDKKLTGEIADPVRHDGYASWSSPPSTTSATRAGRWEDREGTRIRFAYPVGNGDVDWRKLENAVLGEDVDGGYDCTGYGIHVDELERESRSGSESLMRIGKHGVRGGYSPRFTAPSLWIEVGPGSAALGEVRRELRRLDQLGLLQVSRG